MSNTAAGSRVHFLSTRAHAVRCAANQFFRGTGAYATYYHSNSRCQHTGTGQLAGLREHAAEGGRGDFCGETAVRTLLVPPTWRDIHGITHSRLCHPNAGIAGDMSDALQRAPRCSSLRRRLPATPHAASALSPFSTWNTTISNNYAHNMRHLNQHSPHAGGFTVVRMA